MGFPTNNIFNVPGYGNDQAATQKAFQDAMTAAQQREIAQSQNAWQAALNQGQLGNQKQQIANQFAIGQGTLANQAAEIAAQKAVGELGYQTQQNIANTQGEYGLKNTSAQGEINKLLAAIQNQGELDVAKQQGQTQLGVAGLTTQSAQDIARLQAANALQLGQLGSQTQLSQTGMQTKSAQDIAALQAANALQLGSQQGGFQTGIANAANAANIRQAEIAAQASTVPAYLQQQRFSQILPFLSGGGGVSGGGGGGGYSFGGSGGSTGGFDFTSGNLGASGMAVSPALEQTNINRDLSQTHQKEMTDISRVPQGFTGRGWTGTNPRSIGDARHLQAAGLQTDAEAMWQEHNNTNQANTDASLKNRAIQGQLASAQIGAGASRYGAEVAAGASNRNALLQALSSLV